MKIEKILGVLASSYEKAARLPIEKYYHQVAEEMVPFVKDGTAQGSSCS